jgi:predicted AAA+ superfamily ATPase
VKYAKRGLGTIQKEIEVGLFALNGQVSFLFLYNNNLHDIFLFSLIFKKKKKEKENYRKKMKIPPYSPSLRYALNLSTSKATLKGVCLCICVCLPCLLSLELLREYRV